MKKFIRYLMTCLIIPSLIVFVNVFIDYRQFINFKSGFMERLVNDLSKNHLVLNVNVPERKIVKKRINKFIGDKKNIVIGSSRIALIGKGSGNNYINFGVSGFVIEDMSHIYNLLTKNNIKIDTLIIGIDPWFFNKSHGEERHLQFKNEFNIQNARYLLSIRYFLDNMLIRKYHIWDGQEPEFVRFSDGSIKYSSEQITKGRMKINQELSYISQGDGYHIKNYKKIDKNYYDSFNILVIKFQELSNKVILLLNSYHPLAYDELIKVNSIIPELERKLLSFYLANEQISIFGSFNPHILNLDSSHFIDLLHLNNKGQNKIISLLN